MKLRFQQWLWDVFPDRLCSQLSLQGSSALGAPPSTLPTVSNNEK